MLSQVVNRQSQIAIIGGAKGDKEEYAGKLENKGWMMLRGGGCREQSCGRTDWISQMT